LKKERPSIDREEARNLAPGNHYKRRTAVPPKTNPEALIGNSKRMQEVNDLIKTVAGCNSSVLITGESGTGKDLVALTLHKLSVRAHGPFIVVNPAAIPEGLVEGELFGYVKGAFTGAVEERPGCFELASGGTLFLDDIAEMTLLVQPKLLRALEGGCVRKVGCSTEENFNVRIIAATSRDPKKAVETGALRKDLYFRLNVFTLFLPALREHKDDIPQLVQHFVELSNQKHLTVVTGIHSEALQLLMDYSWPGNVRELRNVIERAVILARENWIKTAHLPPHIRNPVAQCASPIVLYPGVSMAKAEEMLILQTLKSAGNNKSAAARQLGVDVKTLRHKLKSYGMH